MDAHEINARVTELAGIRQRRVLRRYTDMEHYCPKRRSQYSNQARARRRLHVPLIVQVAPRFAPGRELQHDAA